jgi:long-chain acyl-CoA synthetase
LRACFCGGAPLPAATRDAFQARFGLTILEGYGMAETSPVVSLNPQSAPRSGSVGLPMWGTEVAIINADGRRLPPGEIGDIVVRGHNVMKGYYKRPEATAETLRNGWLHTGDIGSVDADGYVYIVSRKKDAINHDSSNVDPREE